MTNPPLYPYQAAGVDFLASQGRALLADDMGLGKSRMAIEAADFAQGPKLVVAPAMVVDGGVWATEIGKWARDPSEWTVTAYSRLSPTVSRGKGHAPSEKLGEAFAQPWSATILDEAHYVKSRKSTRTDLVSQLGPFTHQLFALTGTPIPNYAHEAFTLLRLLFPEDAKPGKRFGSYWKWIDRWFSVTSTPFSNFVVGGLLECNRKCAELPPDQPCEHWQEFTSENFQGRILRRLRDDVLSDLPPATESEVDTPMGPAQKRGYRQMRQEFIAQLDSGTVVAWSNGAKQVKLDRISTSLYLADPDSPITREQAKSEDSSKLAMLRRDLSARKEEYTVVMAHYRDTVEACAEVARSLGMSVSVIHGGTAPKQRREIVEEFQAGGKHVLVGSLETLAEGLTLTRADMLVFVEMSYKPSRNQQAMRRIHRIGQARAVSIVSYLTPNTVDANKRKLLAHKTDQQMRALSPATWKEIV